MKNWKATPCLVGRLAVEADVKEGRATFYMAENPEVKPLEITLPVCALHHDVDTKKTTPVILIQAIEMPKGKIIGIRYIDGGNGVCTLAELEILKAPDERFK